MTTYYALRDSIGNKALPMPEKAALRLQSNWLATGRHAEPEYSVTLIPVEVDAYYEWNYRLKHD